MELLLWIEVKIVWLLCSKYLHLFHTHCLSGLPLGEWRPLTASERPRGNMEASRNCFPFTHPTIPSVISLIDSFLLSSLLSIFSSHLQYFWWSLVHQPLLGLVIFLNGISLSVNWWVKTPQDIYFLYLMKLNLCTSCLIFYALYILDEIKKNEIISKSCF